MERNERIVSEESPKGESESNDDVENAIEQVQGQFRTVKDAPESRIGKRIGGDSALIPWMVVHAARTINRYHVAPNGKTNYERCKGQEVQEGSRRVRRNGHVAEAQYEGDGQVQQ